MKETERIIAIGDIHGCLNSLKRLIDELKIDNKTDRLVFIGDYIDRGKYSFEVIQYLLELRRYMGFNNCILLRGNHEQMLIDCGGCPDSLWIRNGAYATMDSFFRHGEEPSNYLNFFKNLPLVCESENAFFCHAGFTYPYRTDNTDFDLLWGRDWIETDSEEREKTVIFGHTPNWPDFGIYTTATGDICIDGGCVYGGCLCALAIHEDGSADKFQTPQHRGDK